MGADVGRIGAVGEKRTGKADSPGCLRGNAMMPDFFVFYCRHRTGDSIESYDPMPMPLERIVDLAANVLESDGDFLGLVDDDDGLLQFMYLASSEDDERPIRMEFPVMARHGYYTKQVSSSELLQVLRDLPDRLSADAIPGLHFESDRGR